MPGEAGLDLGDVDVAAGEQHLAHEALVFVALGPFDDDRAAGDLVREVLPGDLPKGLAEFRGINPREPDFVLGLGGIEHCDRVAVVDAYDSARQLGGIGGEKRREQPYCEYEPERCAVVAHAYLTLMIAGVLL